MKLVLGIDTGGTYTDSVIINLQTNEVISKFKALTTKDNLIDGITESLKGLDSHLLSQVASIKLSTTLATNAVVESRGTPVGLLYMGEELTEKVPKCRAVKLHGKLNILGEEYEPLNKEQVELAVSEMSGYVNTIAISGYGSTRNPSHEKQVCEWIKKITDLPVICGHELTSALGFQERTATAVINGSLMPILSSLMDSVKIVMDDMGLDVPLMIVRGNGTLMSEQTARIKPVETMLSGPAASIIGATFICDVKNALIMDIGGTTTDVALLADGKVHIQSEGARIGRWRTRVEAARVSTFGLGGDSYIRPDKKGRLQIGPERAIPVSSACAKYPYLEGELRSFTRSGGENKKWYPNEGDCYLLGNHVRGEALDLMTDIEKRVLDFLREGPHSIYRISSYLGIDGELLDFERMVEAGYIRRIGFTPTDIFQMQNRLNLWNRRGAEKTCKILARRLEINIWDMIEQVERQIQEMAANNIFQACLDFDDINIDIHDDQGCRYFTNQSIWKKNGLIRTNIEVTEPIIAIGAPAVIFAELIKDRVRTDIIVPEHAEVANAVGAAVCKVTESIEMTIIIRNKKVILASREGKHVYDTEEEAMFYAVHIGRMEVQHKLRAAGFESWKIEEELKFSCDGTQKKLIINGEGV